MTAEHLGTTRHYYFDIPFGQAVRRHATRPTAKEFTPEQMREWYRERDLLPSIEQEIIKESSSLDETVARILAELAWRPDRANSGTTLLDQHPRRPAPTVSTYPVSEHRADLTGGEPHR